MICCNSKFCCCLVPGQRNPLEMSGKMLTHTKVLDLLLNKRQGSRGQFSMVAEQPSGAAQDRSLQQHNMGYDSRMKLQYYKKLLYIFMVM